MQCKQDLLDAKIYRDAACVAGPLGTAAPQRSCYGVQVLVAGRRKQWRDDISAQIRRAGYSAITVDSAVDALTVLVLGLPVDVLVTDAELRGALDCAQLAAEARALRPNLGIVLAGAARGRPDPTPPDAILLARTDRDEGVAVSVREALAARAA